MPRTLLRLVPAALALAAIAFAMLLPSRRSWATRPDAAPAAVAAVGCNIDAVAGTDSTTRVYAGIRQPFDGTVPFASCSLAVSEAGYVWPTFRVQAWDPVALAPDPTTVALRSIGFDASQLGYNHVRLDFSPPVVVQPVTGVAEPTRTTLDLDMWVGGSYLNQYVDVRFWSQGTPGLPPGFQYFAAGQAPLGGPAATAGLGLCSASGREELRVLQAVSGTSTLLGFDAYDYLQRFRVPQACTLEWVELAFGYNANASPYVEGTVVVLEGDSIPAPGSTLPGALLQADFYHPGLVTPHWDTHYLYAPPVELQPDRDYLLLVRSKNKYPLYVHDHTGNESADFATGIGPLFVRPTEDAPWVPEQAGRALCFRLLGTPVSSPVAVEPIVVPAGLRLAIEPNPARGATLVRWRGARGAVRLDVLDARGRRLASHDAGGEVGEWLWTGGRGGGGRVAPGVYFVRVADATGAIGTSRVVMVR